MNRRVVLRAAAAAGIVGVAGCLGWGRGGDDEWTNSDHGNRIVEVVANDGTLYTSSRDDRVRKVDAETGETLWTYSDHWTDERRIKKGERRYKTLPERDYLVRALATDDDGNVYVGADTEEVRKVGPDGETRWRYTGHVVEETPPRERTPGVENRIVALAVGNDAVYSVGRHGELHKLPLEPSTAVSDGDVAPPTDVKGEVPVFEEPIWAYEDDASITDVTLTPGGDAYIAVNPRASGAVRRVDGETGRQRWSSGPVDSYGGFRTVERDSGGHLVVYNETADEEIRKIDPGDVREPGGEDVVWRFHPETDLTIQSTADVDVDDADVYVVLRPSTFDDEPGKILRVDHGEAPTDGSVFHRATEYETGSGGTALAVTDEYVYYAEYERRTGLLSFRDDVTTLVALPKRAL